MGQAKPAELGILWKATAGRGNSEYPTVNFGACLVQRFIETAKHTEYTSDIHFGGMVTWIACHLGLESLIEDWQLRPVSPGPYLDLIDLRAMHLCKSARSNSALQVLLVRERAFCYLPNPLVQASRPLGTPFPWRLVPQTIAKEDITRQEQEELAFRPPVSAIPIPEVPEPPPAVSIPPTVLVSAPPPPVFVPPTAPSDGAGPSGAQWDLSDVLGAIGEIQTRQDTQFTTLMRELEVLRRVTWRTHLALVQQGMSPGFPNHPEYPPALDINPSDPIFREDPAHHPYYRAPGADSEDD